MVAKQLSFIVTCKGRLEYLKQTLPFLVAQPDCDVIVVDYDCPERTAERVATAHPSVNVVRIANRSLFSATEARKKGARAARTLWLCFVDADIVIDGAFSKSIRPMLDRRLYFVAEPASPQKHGTIVVAREDFRRVGGYDQVFEGWGWEDFDIRERLELAHVTELTFPGTWLAEIDHPDQKRTEFYPVKAKNLSAKLNLIYMMAKLNLISLERNELPEAFRRKLYKHVRELVNKSPRARQYELTVTLPPRRLFGTNVVQTRTLQLKLNADNAESEGRAVTD